MFARFQIDKGINSYIILLYQDTKRNECENVRKGWKRDKIRDAMRETHKNNQQFTPIIGRRNGWTRRKILGREKSEGQSAVKALLTLPLLPITRKYCLCHQQKDTCSKVLKTFPILQVLVKPTDSDILSQKHYFFKRRGSTISDWSLFLLPYSPRFPQIQIFLPDELNLFSKLIQSLSCSCTPFLQFALHYPKFVLTPQKCFMKTLLVCQEINSPEQADVPVQVLMSTQLPHSSHRSPHTTVLSI